MRPGSSWSARSRAAARTNELDAGKRREIIESEEGGRLRLAYLGVVLRVPGAWLAEWSRKHPSGAAGVRAAAMTMCPGPGLLSQMIERGAGAGSCRRASAPGAW